MFHLLSYAPIARGLAAIAVAGTLFPVNGVFILRLNLITFRFMLMHGTLLGGALALAIGIDPLPAGVAVDLLLVAGVASTSNATRLNTGHITVFFMVLAIALAFAVVYRFNVPAKDTLDVLWGNVYALTPADLAVTGCFAVAASAAVGFNFRKLAALLFNREIAFTSGVNDRALVTFLLVLTGLTVAFAMRLVGALLLDSLLLLPAIVATLVAKSLRATFVWACGIGLGSAVLGFFLSIALDIPASSGATIVSSGALGIALLLRRTGS